MDWIEKIFHVSLDGGNGMVELALYLIAAVTAVWFGGRRLARGRRRR